VYRPDKPLSCGARVWIETDAEIKIKWEILFLDHLEQVRQHTYYV
jgi:hypothetical protein